MRDIGARSADSWAVFGGVRRPLCVVGAATMPFVWALGCFLAFVGAR